MHTTQFTCCMLDKVLNMYVCMCARRRISGTHTYFLYSPATDANIRKINIRNKFENGECCTVIIICVCECLDFFFNTYNNLISFF